MPPTPPPPSSFADRLRAIETRVTAACARAGRARAAVRLVGASKMQPVELLAEAFEAGLATLGENRVQEGVRKSALLPGGIDWHLLGPLQSNKVRSATRLFSLFHAVDRPSIALELDREAERQGRRLGGLLEVNLGGEATKHGFEVEGLEAAVAPLAALRNLEIRGLMAIPPPGPDPEASRPWFRALRELADRLGARPEWSGRMRELSMGMSDDFEVAIEEGATLVRVGTALFGERGGHAAPPRASE
jgi:pyridoxal phosphate enzyme (YggS family)